MKRYLRLIAFALVAMMLIALAGCGGATTKTQKVVRDGALGMRFVAQYPVDFGGILVLRRPLKMIETLE